MSSSKHARTRHSRRGEGTIVKVREGLYRAQVSLGFDAATGKRVRWSAYAPTVLEARRARAKFLAKRHQSVAVGSLQLTVNGWLDTWVQRVKDNSRTHLYRLDKLRPVRQYLGSLRLHALRQTDVHQLINETLSAPRPNGRVLSPTTRKHVRDVLRAALNDACEDDDIELARNVAKGVKVKGYRDDFSPRVLSDAECSAFLQASASFDSDRLAATAKTQQNAVTMHAYWVLALELGLRQGELLGLRWDKVDLVGKHVTVSEQLQRVRGGGSRAGLKRLDGKNFEFVPLKARRASRPLPLSPDCVTALKAHARHQARLQRKLGVAWNLHGLVFPTVGGLPMQGSALRGLYFAPVCRRAGVIPRTLKQPGGFRIHDCRHTAATRMLRRTKSLVHVQTMLGHSTVKMTERYIHLIPLDERKLVAA